MGVHVLVTVNGSWDVVDSDNEFLLSEWWVSFKDSIFHIG